MEDFDFIEHCAWLKPFIAGLVKYCNGNNSERNSSNESNSSNDSNDNDETISYQIQKYNELNIFRNSCITFEDANEYAIYNLDKIFKNDCFTWFYCNHYSWLECVEKGNEMARIKCRNSCGFDNRSVPITKKFNPIFNDKKYREEYILAIYSYNYLYYRMEIDTILKTPLSDYTRFNSATEKNVLNRFFMTNLRLTQERSVYPGSLEHVLTTYNSKCSDV